MTRPTVIVVGGGISGLVSAWTLRDVADVTLLESSERLGGKIETTVFRGRPLDIGPDAFIVRNTAGVALCEELGIDTQLIEPSSKNAAIYTRGHLRALPDQLVFGIPTRIGALYRSHVISLWGVLRVLRDRYSRVPLVSEAFAEKVRTGQTDPTVGEIFAPRFGAAIVSNLIDPLVGGINASDVKTLSFASSMPMIFDRIIGQKSVMRALQRNDQPETTESGSIFRGLGPGMSSLVDTIVNSLSRSGANVICNEPVTGLSLDASGAYVLTCRSGQRMADAVILATPSFVSSDLVRQLSVELAEELSEIPYAGVATASFAWAMRDVPQRIARELHSLLDIHDGKDSRTTSQTCLPGSGVLIARDAKMLSTATSFTSTKWPRSSREDEIVIRASVGRHNDAAFESLSDEELIESIRREIKVVLGIAADPLEVLVKRWPRSFPQYVSGHRARVRRIEELATGIGVGLVGAAYHGIGLPSCIANARSVSQRVADRFGPAR
ncbi:MAG TPA: protoporphyrinogen oxidase [Acidimicrobiales bacterium]|nr:protoporphyrinogen oxidase [Acidimicrobiales bacterium]